MTGESEELLTAGEVIAVLQVSRATFARWRRAGAGPAWVRLPGGGVRVRRGALDAWLGSRRTGDDQREEEGAR